VDLLQADSADLPQEHLLADLADLLPVPPPAVPSVHPQQLPPAAHSARPRKALPWAPHPVESVVLAHR